MPTATLIASVLFVKSPLISATPASIPTPTAVLDEMPLMSADVIAILMPSVVLVKSPLISAELTPILIPSVVCVFVKLISASPENVALPTLVCVLLKLIHLVIHSYIKLVKLVHNSNKKFKTIWVLLYFKCGILLQYANVNII